jgi:hypothetical protein
MPRILSWLGLNGRPVLEQRVYESHDSITVLEKEKIAKIELENAKRDEIQKITETILQAYTILLKSDLRPSEATNKLFGQLVSLCTQIHDLDTVQEVSTKLVTLERPVLTFVQIDPFQR